MAIALDDLLFLSSPEGLELALRLKGKDALTLARLCAHLPMERRRALSEYLALGAKIAKKFATDLPLLLDALAYEQSTAADLSMWKAKLLAQGQTVADLCCGMGADSIFLDPQISVLGVDLAMERCVMFQRNMELMRPGGLSQALCADVNSLPLNKVDLWFCDPDRRGGERHGQWDPSQMRPNFAELDALLQKNPRAMLKLPPSTDWQALPWKNARYSYLGDARSCRELLVEIAPEQKGGLCAVHVEMDEYLSLSEGKLESLAARSLGGWLYEPSPVAVRSRLYLPLAKSLGLAPLDPQIAYLTGDEALEHPYLERFQVLESLAWDPKQVKKALKKWDAGEVIVKKRSVDVNPDQLSKELSFKKGARKVHLILTKQGAKILAVIALRA